MIITDIVRKSLIHIELHNYNNLSTLTTDRLNIENRIKCISFIQYVRNKIKTRITIGRIYRGSYYKCVKPFK